jgi:hypothetical protein
VVVATYEQIMASCRCIIAMDKMMRRKPRILDVTSIPELLRLAEEVEASGEPYVLRRDREDLAVVVPVSNSDRRPRRPRAKTREDLEAFRSAAGSWRGFDVDRFLADNAASREASVRPPVEL